MKKIREGERRGWVKIDTFFSSKKGGREGGRERKKKKKKEEEGRMKDGIFFIQENRER